MMIHYSCRPLSLEEKNLHHNLSAAFQLLWHILSGGPALQPRAAFRQMLRRSEIVVFARRTHHLGSRSGVRSRWEEHVSHKRRLNRKVWARSFLRRACEAGAGASVRISSMSLRVFAFKFTIQRSDSMVQISQNHPSAKPSTNAAPSTKAVSCN